MTMTVYNVCVCVWVWGGGLTIISTLYLYFCCYAISINLDVFFFLDVWVSVLKTLVALQCWYLAVAKLQQASMQAILSLLKGSRFIACSKLLHAYIKAHGKNCRCMCARPLAMSRAGL